MKFTKEEAFEKLKGMLTNNGRKTLRMSERSLDGHIEDLMSLIGNDEMELEDFLEKAKGFLERANSNAEKDRSDFVKEWKKANGEPAKKNATDDNADDKKPADDYNALLERIAALETKNAEEVKTRSIEQKRSELVKKLKEKGVEDSEWTSMILGEISVSEDLDVDAKAESLLKLYNRQKASTPKGWTPGTPSGKEDANELFADVKKLKQQRDEAQKSIV